MKRPPYPPADELSATGSMTPMIDVVFLLLIFFVCAASGQTIEDLLPTNMPPTGGVEAPVQPPDEELIPQDKLWIYLSRSVDGRTLIELNDVEYDNYDRLKQVLDGVAELDASSPVILDIDADVPVGDMIRVYDLCHAAGYESISFAAEAPAGR